MSRRLKTRTLPDRIDLPYNWSPRSYQIPAWKALELGAKRTLLLWHRRAGKDSLCLNWCATQAAQVPGIYWHVFPTYNQGKKIIWDGKTKEGRPFRDMFPPGFAMREVEDEMMIELRGGSLYQIVGTDNIDRLVGANPIGVIMSEYALQDPAAWNLIRPILAENGGWAIFAYTPRGRNHGYKFYRAALAMMEKDPQRWFVQKLTVDDTRAIRLEAIDEDRQSGMPEETIEQEYWCSFDAALVGSYYGDMMSMAQRQERVTKVPWLSSFPVDTWWDIGVSDVTSIWFVQRHGLNINVIDYYENHSKGIEHYARVLKEKPYVYGEHVGPHDVGNMEWGTGKTRLEQALNFGIRFRIAPKLSLQDGIYAVRSILSRCYFDAVLCERGVDALSSYSKEWDDVTQTFHDRPLHNWASHPADAFRYGAIGMREQRDKPVQTIAQNDWDPFHPPAQRYTEDWDPFNPGGP